MSDFFRDLMKAEPRSMDAIRDSLDHYEIDELNLFSILREHHGDLSESIEILMDAGTEGDEKHTHLFRFFRLLEMHGKAEQETLYANLKSCVEKGARLEGHAGQDEHDLAFQLQDELQDMGCVFNWTEEIAAKAKVLAGLVKNHIAEEESTMFDVAEKSLSPSMMRAMTGDYLTKCRMYLDDSEMMSREAIGLAAQQDSLATLSSAGVNAIARAVSRTRTHVDTPVLNARGETIAGDL